MGDWQEIMSMDGEYAPWNNWKVWEDSTRVDSQPYEDNCSDFEGWCKAMESRGYSRGPRFSSYSELSNWDKTNKRPHVRRRSPNGFDVYFTDMGD